MLSTRPEWPVILPSVRDWPLMPPSTCAAASGPPAEPPHPDRPARPLPGRLHDHAPGAYEYAPATPETSGEIALVDSYNCDCHR